MITIYKDKNIFYSSKDDLNHISNNFGTLHLLGIY